MTRNDLEIPSGDSTLAAWHYAPSGAGPAPVIVMAHGFSLTRHDGLPAYAETFCEAGYHVVVFDYRNLGDSGGDRRQRFRAGEQREDWRAAVAAARVLPGVDPSRVLLWGYSFSGGHVASLLLEGIDVAGALMLCPFLDGFRRFRGTPPRTAAWIIPRAIADALGRHTTIPVTARDQRHGAMNLSGEYDGFHAALGNGSPWRNEISPAVFLSVPLFRPWRKADRVRVPVWVGRFSTDISVDPEAVAAFAEKAPRAEFREFTGDHFDPFYARPGTDGPTDVIAAQVSFLTAAFPPSR